MFTVPFSLRWRTVDDINRIIGKVATLVGQGRLTEEQGNRISVRLGIELADKQGCELVLREKAISYVTPDFGNDTLTLNHELYLRLLPTAMVATDAWDNGTLN